MPTELTTQTMTPRPCPACGHRLASHRGHVDGIPILQCVPCKTFYTADVTIEDFGEQYESYYTDENLHAPEFTARSLDRIFAGFEGYRQSNRLLDVGFGGAFAMLAAERAGWDVEGIEVSEPAVKHAQELGLKAFHGDLRDVGYPEGHFDVILLSEVLEHVGNPLDLLHDTARVLRPGGLLWVTTPHGLGVSSRVLGLEWSVMCPPEHLQLFSRRALRHMLESTGFTVQRLVTENLNPFEITNAWKTRLRGQVPVATFDRVHSNYEILETVYSRRSLTLAKHGFHVALNAMRLGDSLKAWATKN